MTLTVEIPDAHLFRVVVAVAQQRGVDMTPMGKDEWLALLRQDVVTYLTDVVQRVEGAAISAKAMVEIAKDLEDFRKGAL